MGHGGGLGYLISIQADIGVRQGTVYRYGLYLTAKPGTGRAASAVQRLQWSGGRRKDPRGKEKVPYSECLFQVTLNEKMGWRDER